MQEIEDTDMNTDEADDDVCRLNRCTYVIEYKFKL